MHLTYICYTRCVWQRKKVLMGVVNFIKIVFLTHFLPNRVKGREGKLFSLLSPLSSFPSFPHRQTYCDQRSHQACHPP